MPTYRIHIIGGLASFAGLYYMSNLVAPQITFTWYELAGFAALALVGSVFPDIDVKSNMQKIFYGTMVVALPAAYFLNFRVFILLAATSLVLLVLRHRGITHQAWFLIAAPLSLGAYLIHYQAHDALTVLSGCIYFSLGALSHILLDRISARFLKKK